MKCFFANRGEAIAAARRGFHFCTSKRVLFVRRRCCFLRDKTTLGGLQSSSLAGDEDECALVPLPQRKKESRRMDEKRDATRFIDQSGALPCQCSPETLLFSAAMTESRLPPMPFNFFCQSSFPSVECRRDATSAVAARRRRNCSWKRSSSLRGTSSPRARTEKARNTYYTRLEWSTTSARSSVSCARVIVPHNSWFSRLFGRTITLEQ